MAVAVSLYRLCTVLCEYSILAPRNHGSGNMETDIPERKPPLIGLITIHKKIERMSSPEPLYIGQISYILHNCQSVSLLPNSMDFETGIFIVGC